MDSRYPGGLTSSAFFAGDLSLFAMLMILILDIFIWMVLAVWFDGILPSMLPILFYSTQYVTSSMLFYPVC